jgi:hypothetical protein
MLRQTEASTTPRTSMPIISRPARVLNYYSKADFPMRRGSASAYVSPAHGCRALKIARKARMDQTASGRQLPGPVQE